MDVYIQVMFRTHPLVKAGLMTTIELTTVGKLQRFCALGGLTYRFGQEGTGNDGSLFRDGKHVGFFHITGKGK